MGKYALLIIPAVLSGLMIIAGVIMMIAPLDYDRHEFLRYPAYRGKIATQSQEIWNSAQKIYGKMILVFGIVNMLISFGLVKLFFYFTDNFWKYEDATFPALIILCCPSYLFIIISNIVTKRGVGKTSSSL